MSGITAAQRSALARLAPALQPGTYLAGGVAAALVLDHRRSLDLDLFVPQDFDEDRLAERLAATVPGVRIVGRARGTLHLEVDGVPTSILSYRYPQLAPPARVADLALPVASVDDLVCMKLLAIAGRGAAKDFWDLDALLAHGAAGGSLPQALESFARKYRSEDVGHVVRSLAYFADADAAPLPAGLEPDAWRELKRRMLERVRAL
jgi:Nucleotidyl transferase AbiEii toxin, Type IV TA system